MRILLCLTAVGVLAFTAFAQPVADVHPATGHAMRGPFVGGGRYEIRSATMLDLVRTAYSVDADKVYGGPSWLEMDRFDVTAKLPAGTTPESRKAILQGLLADRFRLVVHNDTKPLPALALTAQKHGGLKEADATAEPGCKQQANPGPRPAAGDAPRMALPREFQFVCHNVTMEFLAERLTASFSSGQYLNNQRVVDQTGLKGAWDLSFTFTAQFIGLPNLTGEPVTTIFEAVDKQLGLKLEPANLPMAVLVVDSVNRTPTANAPDILKSLPAPPTEFEVASLKPTDPTRSTIASGAVMLNGQPAVMQAGKIIQPLMNGRVTYPSFTLKNLILLAWDITDDKVAGLPKFAETDRYDLIAKLPSAAGEYEGAADTGTVRPMVRNLLIQRFKIASHTEDRPAQAFVLTAVKPKLKPADPASRTRCQPGPGPNSTLSQSFACQNITMAQFADLLPTLAGGYVTGPVVDASALAGAWDFTISFSPAGLDRARQLMQSISGSTSGTNGPAEPSGGLTLFDALTRQLGLKLDPQKRPMPVLVIDHIEPKPLEN